MSTSAARRGAIVIVGAAVAGVMAAAPAIADEDSGSGVSAQGSVRSSPKASPGNTGAASNNQPASDHKATPQTRVPAGNRACNCETPHPESSASAQQISVRHDRSGTKRIVSTHDKARSSTTRIVARDNADGSRTVSDQHGSSTFWPGRAKASAPEQAPPAPAAPAAPAPAPPPGQAPVSSGDTWTIVVGGYTDTEAAVFTGSVDARVVYSAQLSGASAQEGVDNLNRMIREHRAAFPDQHIKVVGYSEGAAVVHTWASQNAGTIDNVNTVLISDPKREGGPGGNGLSGQPYAAIVGSPLSGSDSNFGNIPTVSVCTDDFICDGNAPSGIPGYLGNAHRNYSFNVDDYADNGNGQIFNGQFIPW